MPDTPDAAHLYAALVSNAGALIGVIRDQDATIAGLEEINAKLRRRTTSCCFCGEELPDLNALMAHSAQCPKHPLFLETQRLISQLPEGMKHCTIVFLECPQGHGRLTATNWAPRGCPHCEMKRLALEITGYQKAMDLQRRGMESMAELMDGLKQEVRTLKGAVEAECAALQERFQKLAEEHDEATNSHDVPSDNWNWHAGMREAYQNAVEIIEARRWSEKEATP